MDSSNPTKKKNGTVKLIPGSITSEKLESSPQDYLCWCRRPLAIREDVLGCSSTTCSVRFKLADLERFFHCAVCKCVRVRDECNCLRHDPVLIKLVQSKRYICDCRKAAWIRKTKKHDAESNFYFAACATNTKDESGKWTPNCKYWKRCKIEQ